MTGAMFESAISSSVGTTASIADRVVKRYVRPEKNPARCEASWTESLKAKSFRSVFSGVVYKWPTATLARVAERDAKNANASSAQHAGQRRTSFRGVPFESERC